MRTEVAARTGGDSADADLGTPPTDAAGGHDRAFSPVSPSPLLPLSPLARVSRAPPSSTSVLWSASMDDGYEEFLVCVRLSSLDSSISGPVL